MQELRDFYGEETYGIFAAVPYTAKSLADALSNKQVYVDLGNGRSVLPTSKVVNGWFSNGHFNPRRVADLGEDSLLLITDYLGKRPKDTDMVAMGQDIITFLDGKVD